MKNCQLSGTGASHEENTNTAASTDVFEKGENVSVKAWEGLKGDGNSNTINKKPKQT